MNILMLTAVYFPRLVLLEAMALGVPVVSTAVMGTASVLRGAGGAVIAPEDVDGFAKAVAMLLRSPARRNVLAAAGPQDAARWSASALVERTAALYAELAPRRPLATARRRVPR